VSGATVLDRALGGRPLSFIDEDYATSQQGDVDVSQQGSMAESETLIGELEHADYVVIGTPMHNFTAPAALRLWIDLVVRARRTFEVTRMGKVGKLRDRPVFVAISSGGVFSGARARQPDFLTPYLKAVLGVAGLQDVAFFSIQGTAYGPDAVAERRADVEAELKLHFASFSS
jgi:FMN-dependent NADH-azoreductase